MATSSKSISNMRGAFKLVLMWILIFVAIYSWNSWNSVKQTETNQLSLLAELESKSLNSFFTHFESNLKLLTQDLLRKEIPMESESVHLQLIRFMQANTELANVVIMRPDGQIIAAAYNPQGEKFPSYANEPSFIAGKGALQTGLDFDIGRPTYGKLKNQWVLPLRYAVRDASGKLKFIIAAPMLLSSQQNFWESFFLPQSAIIGLLRDDGYLLSLYPVPKLADQEASYGKPRTGVVMNFLQANSFPVHGVVEGETTRHENNIAAFYRLPHYPVTLFVATPSSYIRMQWLLRIQAFYLLSAMSLLSGYGFYLWIMRRQAEWELEETLSQQKIIDANHAKDQAEKDLLALELDDVKLAMDQHSIVSRADVKGNITYVNHKFCEVSGYNSEELLGQNHRMLKSGLHAPDFFIEMWHTISSGKIWKGDIRNKKKDGSFYWVESTIVPLLNKEGKPYQYVSVRTDITPYIEARAAAEAANRTKSQFLSSMSHELRTPLNAILGFGQLLEMQVDPDKREQQEYVGHMLAAGNQLLGLINDLLDLSRIEMGKLNFNIQKCSIADLALGSVSLVLSSLAKNINITIENTIDDAELLVQGDELRIRQVLINLLSNAVKYNRENGRVTLSCFKWQDGKLRIEVRDTGEGISSDKLPLLFKHFERLDQKHGAIEGAGIGLYVCKQLIEAMHGEIGAESVKGEGSTFWFALPIADEKS